MCHAHQKTVAAPANCDAIQERKWQTPNYGIHTPSPVNCPPHTYPYWVAHLLVGESACSENTQ